MFTNLAIPNWGTTDCRGFPVHLILGERSAPGNVNMGNGQFADEYIDVLVGGLNPSEEILVNWDDYSQYMGK